MINKTDIILKLNKYNNTNLYFFEKNDIKLYIAILASIFYLVSLISLIYNKYELSMSLFIFGLFFSLAYLSIIIYNIVKYNNKINKIAKELNVKENELKYFIKKYHINEE
jgi:hypothetical protein